MGRSLAMLALLCACNARLGEMSGNTSHLDAWDAIGDASTDGRGDATAGKDAVVLGAWGTPTPIPGASTATNGEDDDTLSANTLDLIFAFQPAGAATKSLYEMTRATTTAAWTTPVQLTTIDIGMSEESPRLSLDDLTLYFGIDGDIYQSTRATIGGAFSAPTKVTAISTTAYEKWMAICAGNVVMVSRANGANEQDLFEGTLTGGATTADTVLNSASNEISTYLSPDCLTVYFSSDRSGQSQLYTSTRATINDAWTTPTLAPTPFSPADGSDNEDAWISSDLRTFVFAGIRGAATTKDLYISTR